MPLGVYDQPLPGLRPYKPALLGLGATVYAESAVYLDASSGRAEPDDSLFFGLEAEGRFTLLHLPVSAGVGAVVRVDRRFSEPVGSDDARVYVFLSSNLATHTDALLGATSAAPGAAAAGAAGALPDRLVAPGHAVR